MQILICRDLPDISGGEGTIEKQNYFWNFPPDKGDCHLDKIYCRAVPTRSAL
jgi:hypothetical protein